MEPGENDECRICNQPLLNYLFRGSPVSSACGHWFHGPCLSEYLPRGDGRCPVCQSSMEIPCADRADQIILTYYPSQRMEQELSFMQKLKIAMPYVGISLLVALLSIFVYMYFTALSECKEDALAASAALSECKEDALAASAALSKCEEDALSASAALSECKRDIIMCDDAVEEMRRPLGL